MCTDCYLQISKTNHSSTILAALTVMLVEASVVTVPAMIPTYTTAAITLSANRAKFVAVEILAIVVPTAAATMYAIIRMTLPV